MLTEEEIVATLEPLNGMYFRIDDIHAYARTFLTRGKSLCARLDGELASYVLFYDDDAPESFVSMVWTNPQMLRRGLAKGLLQEIIGKVPKPISLEVDHENVPARRLYENLGFEHVSSEGARERWLLRRRVAIMQPYIYPWIGQLQLIDAADFFVFYDDVNFIKKGRINRNSILVDGRAHEFTVPIAGASQNKLILETEIHDFHHWRDKFLKLLIHTYGKAPFFANTMEVIESVLFLEQNSIADLAIASILSAHAYLGKPLKSARSSQFSPWNRGTEKSQRLIEITKKADGSRYINTPGGKKLYDKSRFSRDGVQLSFLNPAVTEYCQFGKSFVPGLSIIDIMMFNAPGKIMEMIRHYTVE